MRNHATIHVMSRTAGGAFLFVDEAKEAFRLLLWRMATFAGVQVLTYCVMDIHFHILVRVPDKAKWLSRFHGLDGKEKPLALLAFARSRDYVRQLRA